MRNNYFKSVTGAVLLTACSGPAAETCFPDETGRASCVGQARQAGRSLQGRSLQGRSLQGRSLQGAGTAVSTVQQVSINGTAVENLQLQGTLLSGSLAGRAIAGADFIGASVIQQDVDGSLFDSTITNVAADPQDATGEILLYTLTSLNAATGAVENLCEPDPWGGQYATPVSGTWTTSGAHVDSSTQFTFACTSGVVAKCVRWGYSPWKTVSGRSLADYHQACTRMARADYCGDGVSYTNDGTLVDLYDDLKIQKKSPPSLLSPLFFDAAWTANGAYCLSKDRWLKLTSLISVTLSCKSRFTDLTPLLETSPVDATDLCIIKRGDLSRSEVHIDNRSALNLELL